MSRRTRWILIVLAGSEAVIVLDLAFGSIVIDDVMAEFGASLAQLQAVLVAYALIVAALTLVGGWFGSRFGSRRALGIGLAIRAAGAAVTACAFDIWSYALGEAVLAGIGMALVAPAASSLTGSLFEGRERSRAFATVGMSIAVAAGIGPVVGGWLTTELSWRWCDWFECAICLALFAGHVVIPVITRTTTRAGFDWTGVVLSGMSFVLIVFGLNQATSWGLWADLQSPLAPFGLSLTPFVVAAGIVMGALFLLVERRRSALGLPVIVSTDMLRNRALRASLLTTVASQGALAGLLFAIPVYLQVIEGRSAVVSGLYLVPMSITAFLASSLWPRLAARVTVNVLGIVAGGFMLLCAVLVYWDMSPALWGSTLLAGVGVFGLGIGIMDSQLDAVTLSTVPTERSEEAAGLQCTSDNFGSALGIALAGTVMILTLTAGMSSYLRAEPELDPAVRSAVLLRVENGVPVVNVAGAKAFVESTGATPDEVERITTAYRLHQHVALERSLAACGLMALLTIALSTKLPRRRFVDAT